MHPDQQQAIPAATPFRVGSWHVDPVANELQADDGSVRLEPKVMRVLCLLAMRQGRVVSREELESLVWTGMVVTADAVTNTVIKLRRALGDDARQPRYIETLPKTGYRLIADVVFDTPETGQAETAARPPAPLRRPLLRLLTVILVLAGGFLIFRQSPEPVDRTLAPSATETAGIAVLPFHNLAADSARDYFSDGITEDLITDLSKLPGLLVIARNSAFAYQHSNKDERIIANELGVDYILKGSVQRAAGRIRINVRLTDGPSGHNLWAERYDRQIDDLFAIQDEITTRIVSALELEIAPAEPSRMIHNRQASIEAYDEFLQGLDYYGRRSLGDTQLAIRHYERAIAIDPGFARAYAGLALVYSRDAVDGWNLTEQDALQRAAELTEKARRLDPSVPQIYFVEGQIELFRRNYEAAIRNAEQAIAIKPSYADAHALLAWILHFAGRTDEGLASMQRAARLNPRLPSVYRGVRGAIHYAEGEIDKALSDLEAAVHINPSYQMMRIWLAAAYAAAGRLDEAAWEGDEILALDPTFTLSHVAEAFPIRDPGYLQRFLHDLRLAGLPG